MADPNSLRFALKSEEEIDSLLDGAIPQNTKRATNLLVSTFSAFCIEQGITLELNTCSAEELDSALCKFYPSLRKKNGEPYKNLSYFAARAGIHRKTRELE